MESSWLRTPTPRPNRAAAVVAGAVVVAAALAVFSGTLAHGFVFDDFPLVVRNPVLRDARNLVPLLGLDGSLPAPRWSPRCWRTSRSDRLAPGVFLLRSGFCTELPEQEEHPRSGQRGRSSARRTRAANRCGTAS